MAYPSSKIDVVTRKRMNRRAVLQRTGGCFTALAGLSCGLLPMMTSIASANGLPAGFHVPPEDGPHVRTFMQWPTSTVVHPDSYFLEDLQSSVADIANTISEFEPVVMLMDESLASRARRKLAEDIEIWDIPTDDLWCRDAGPLFAVGDDGRTVVSHIQFNGWGNKQFHSNDKRVARRVAERLQLDLHETGLTGEPGGVEWDGAGTLVAHESCWVNPNRNRLTRNEVEDRLLAAYGAEKMIWAPGVKGHDITDDHIDALARFVRPSEIVFQVPHPGDTDIFSRSARKTLSILKSARDARGRALNITEIPSPRQTRVRSGDFLASYANFYVCNSAVICAEFGDRDTDQEVTRVLQSLFPDREIISLNIDPIGETGGGIHCATQQQPDVS